MGLQLERIEEMPDKINSIQQAFKSSLVDLDEEIKNL
jgi:hypothetical protein